MLVYQRVWWIYDGNVGEEMAMGAREWPWGWGIENGDRETLLAKQWHEVSWNKNINFQDPWNFLRTHHILSVCLPSGYVKIAIENGDL